MSTEWAKKVKSAFPGTEVSIADGVTLTVYPVGLIHIEKFFAGMEKAFHKIARLPQLASVASRAGSGLTAEDKADLKAALPQIIQIVIADLLDLVKETCSEDITVLPHFLLPKVVEAWISENFQKEGRLENWTKLLGVILEKTTPLLTKAKDAASNALNSGILSNLSLGADGESSTSSNDNSEESPIQGGHSISSGSE